MKILLKTIKLISLATILGLNTTYAKDFKSLTPKQQMSTASALLNSKKVYVPIIDMCIKRESFNLIFGNVDKMFDNSDIKRVMNDESITVIEFRTSLKPFNNKLMYLVDSSYTCHLVSGDIDDANEVFITYGHLDNIAYDENDENNILYGSADDLDENRFDRPNMYMH